MASDANNGGVLYLLNLESLAPFLFFSLWLMCQGEGFGHTAVDKNSILLYAVSDKPIGNGMLQEYLSVHLHCTRFAGSQ